MPFLQPTPRPPRELPPERRERVAEKTLEVRDLTVRYGGTTAVDEADADRAAGPDPRPDRPERRRQDLG